MIVESQNESLLSFLTDPIISSNSSLVGLDTIQVTNSHLLPTYNPLGFQSLEFSLPDIPEDHNFHLMKTIPYFENHSTKPIVTIQKPASLNKKKFMEHEINCSTCNKDIALALLHCSSKTPCTSKSLNILSSYILDVECVDCERVRIKEEHLLHSFTTLSEIPALNLPVMECQPCVSSKRKRVTDSNEMCCQVCKLKIAQGGFRSLLLGKCDTIKECNGHFTKSFEKTSIDIEGHATEIVCTSCRAKYQFCSECGGGGKVSHSICFTY